MLPLSSVIGSHATPMLMLRLWGWICEAKCVSDVSLLTPEAEPRRRRNSEVLIHSPASRTSEVSASLIPLIFSVALIPARVIYIISSISK